MKSIPPGQSVGGFSTTPGWKGAVPHPLGADQLALLAGVFDRPGMAAVEAAGQEVVLGFLAVDGVDPGTEVLVVPGAEANDDLVAPDPDTVIGRPAAEAARNRIDGHLLDDARLRTAV